MPDTKLLYSHVRVRTLLTAAPIYHPTHQTEHLQRQAERDGSSNFLTPGLHYPGTISFAYETDRISTSIKAYVWV